MRVFAFIVMYISLGFLIGTGLVSLFVWRMR
jgi:hypothetical protein